MRLRNRLAGSIARAALAAALAATLGTGGATAGPATIETAVAADAAAEPRMTVKIYNNTKDYNIYPVLSTGTADRGEWIQAARKIPVSKLKDNPFPKLNQFRLYLNAEANGIPPGGSMVLTLPLLSQLVPTNRIDSKKTDQFVDWWGGGRIEIFRAPASTGKPPPALVDIMNKTAKSLVTPIAGASLPVCVSGCSRPLKIYKDPAGVPHAVPAQLTEYTFGAIDKEKNPWLINPNNVDYDVSYVDGAFMPVAMEPFNNEEVGYVGMIIPVEKFDAALNRFLQTPAFKGWPTFVDSRGRPILKIPSPINILERGKKVPPDLTKRPWPPIDRMKAAFLACIRSTSTEPRCVKLREIKKLFDKNYETYVKNYKANGCDPKQKPVATDDDKLIAKVYAWTPYTEHCKPTDNLLENTPGYKADNYKKYQVVKRMFDQLQELPDGSFDPYVQLIHGKDYIGAKNVYAYSVDDALGNMQVDGNGVIIAVGGKRGLPNGEEATPPIHIPFGYDPKAAVKFVRYGICKEPNKTVNPSFTSFDVSITRIKTCVITLIDSAGRRYAFRINQQPPFPKDAKPTPATRKVVDCSPTKDEAARKACEAGAFAYTTVIGNEVTNYLSFPGPVQPAPKVVRVSFGYGANDKVKYTHYGVCSKTANTPVNPKDTGFNLPFSKIAGCVISLKDNRGQTYSFQITKTPPFPATPRLTKETHAVINCAGNAGVAKRTCDGAFGYTEGKGDQARSYVIFPAPFQ